MMPEAQEVHKQTSAAGTGYTHDTGRDITLPHSKFLQIDPHVPEDSGKGF